MNTQKNLALLDLPPELLIGILSLTDHSTLLAAAKTCGTLSRITKDPILWRESLHQNYPSQPLNRGDDYRRIFSENNKKRFPGLSVRQIDILKTLKTDDLTTFNRINVSLAELDNFPHSTGANPFVYAHQHKSSKILDALFARESKNYRQESNYFLFVLAIKCNQNITFLKETLNKILFSGKRNEIFLFLIEALQVALKLQNLAVLNLLVTQRMEIFISDFSLNSPLMLTVKENLPVSLKFLLDIYLPINNLLLSPSVFIILAFQQSIMLRRTEVIAAFLSHPHIALRINHDFFHKGAGKIKGSMLHRIVNSNFLRCTDRERVAIINQFLNTPKIDINHQVNGQGTPLHIAAETGSTAAVRALLNDSRIDVNAVNAKGQTAWDVRDKTNREIEYLLQEKNSLKKAKEYKAKRENDPREYQRTLKLPFFTSEIKLGDSKPEKMKAVNALLEALEKNASLDELKTLATEHPALTKGELGKIFQSVKRQAELKEKFGSSEVRRNTPSAS